jgi:hypothetical protein
MDQLDLLLAMRFRIVLVPEGSGISFELSPPLVSMRSSKGWFFAVAANGGRVRMSFTRPSKMLRYSRMATMRKLRRGIRYIGQRRQWAVSRHGH